MFERITWENLRIFFKNLLLLFPCLVFLMLLKAILLIYIFIKLLSLGFLYFNSMSAVILILLTYILVLFLDSDCHGFPHFLLFCP